MEAADTSTDCSDRRFKVLGSDEESDGLVAAERADPNGVQRQLRSVRIMSVASVILGMASVVMMAFATMRSADSPKGFMSPSSIVGLSAAPESRDHEMSGWYRSYLECQVRTEERVDSEKVDVLYPGSLVYVAETHGRRARILKPVKGWISMKTAEGITILRPDMTYTAHPNKTDFEAVLRSREVREANERLQQSAMKLTAVEKKLMDALKKLKTVPSRVEDKMLKQWPELADEAPKAGKKLAHHAVHALRVKPEGAKNLLNHVAQNEHVQHIVHSSKLDSLVKRAKHGAKEVQESSADIEKLEESLQEASGEMADTSERLADQVGYTV